MATSMLFILKSYFSFIRESFPADFLHRTMIKVCTFMWVYVLSLFRHLIEHLVGSRIEDTHEKSMCALGGFNDQEEKKVSIFDGFVEDEKSEFTFGFRFQMKEEDLISYNKGTPDVNFEQTDGELITKTSTSKYQFVSVQDFGGFVKEPESGSFTVHELFVEDNLVIKEKGVSQNLDEKVKDEHESFNLDFIEKEVSLSQILQRVDVSNNDEVQKLHEKNELKLGETENGVLKPEQVVGQILDKKVKDELKEFIESFNLDLKEKEVSLDQIPQRVDDSNNDEVQKLNEKSEVNLGETENEVLKHEQVNWLGEFIMRNDSFDPLDYHPESDDSGDGFFSICPQDVDSVIEPESEVLVPSFSDEIDDDYIELEPNLVKEPSHESDSCFEDSLEAENERMRSWEFDSDEEEEDDDDDDVLLEHQELIDQMKMELKNARTGGLPTILEECETTRVIEDYKPLQINEKLEHRDQMVEIQKFYKSYAERMRKLDVLNYQTLQAINFLRMKHPDQTNTGENTSLSAIKSVLLPSLWPCKLRRIYADPTLKSITELHKDLEIVYVGQACLSWEMLYWQYKKVKELQLYDPQGYRSYNQIAIEFQQFHVLLRRFSEDELFQGPRVQNYTKQRCNLRGLLQVPPIRDDNLKEKKARKKEEGDAVSISTMAKMIKESMMVFWEFLHTDKDSTNLFLTIILQGSKAHLQDPADSDLFMDIKATHQKKERRLKDMLRTGNCIVKKFQKQQETILDQHMFVSQVELRLVSRVLSLPRLSRDQLVWCQSKLNNIKLIDRKIHVEDGLFLLFPC